MRLPIRPEAGEYPAYFERYVARVPEGDILARLAAQGEETRALAAALRPGQAAYRYAPGKWSVKAVLAHVADTERVMAFRLLWAARADGAALPSFDQEAWSRAQGADAMPPALLARELAATRAASLSLAAALGPEAWTRRVLVEGASLSARALLYVIAGHELHHRAVLAERYGLGA